MITLNLTPDQVQSLDTVLSKEVLKFRITLSPSELECPFCGGSAKCHGFRPRTYNHLPVSGYPSVIEWRRRRYICTDCRHTFMEHNPFGPEHFHQTYLVLISISKALRSTHATFKDIAEKHYVSDTLVQLYSDSFIKVPRINLPCNLGIDELHSKMAKYGGSYLAVLADNEHRSLNDILPDRSKRTLSRYFEQIPIEERRRVRYVTIDFRLPYKDIALKYLPNCRIAADPFHVIEHLTAGFTRIRVDIMNQCVYNSPEYYLLKKWHKLLETDCDLDNPPKYNSFFRQKMNYSDLFKMLLDLNPSLTTAYRLKEKYRFFNSNCTFEKAPEEPDSLIRLFEEADLYCYREFVGLLKNRRTEIINSFERPYNNRKQSNALSEHINSRLHELIQISNGFANFERFRARSIYCLNDRIFYSLTQHLYSNKRQGVPRGHYKKSQQILAEHPDNDVDTLTDDFIEDE